MRLCYLAAGISLLWAGLAAALDVEEHHVFEAPGNAVLRVVSTADLAVFSPIIEGFQAAYPEVTVDYTVTGTSDLMQALSRMEGGFDLAISSAMDLQTKLVNDGFAQTHESTATDALPAWARWRNQLFAFTQEPAVLVVSEQDFPRGTEPRSRDELIDLLRDQPDRFAGRIGTYDVRKSGFGYLMATQDSRNSDAFWRLMEVMGRLDARLYCCSSDMIEGVASGELALAYNVLGSYAARVQHARGGFRIIEMDDFTNVMLRTALIPRGAKNVAEARLMVDFLSGLATRQDLTEQTGLPAIAPEDIRANAALRPIRFGPGLLVFLDQLRRQTFLSNWQDSLEQE